MHFGEGASGTPSRGQAFRLKGPPPHLHPLPNTFQSGGSEMGGLFFLKDFESGVQVFLEDEGRLSATTSLARGAQGAGRGLEPRLTPRGCPKVAGI